MNDKMKWVLVIFLVALCIWEINPPKDKLKPGIDLAGGTSLLYQIDDSGLEAYQKQQLAQTMIRILRQRIDPSNQTNMVWRAHGTDRIEIQMPQATQETMLLRQNYRETLDRLLETNLDERLARQALIRAEEVDEQAYRAGRAAIFADIAGDSQQRMDLLTALGQAHDTYETTNSKRSTMLLGEAELKDQLESVEIRVFSVDSLQRGWDRLDPNEQTERLESLGADSQTKQSLVKKYIQTRQQLSQVRKELLGEGGLGDQLDLAWDDLITENIESSWVKNILDGKARQRQEKLTQLRQDFPKRVEAIDALEIAHSAYAKVAGRLDDPEDLIRKLRGSGVLEFRILPVIDGDALNQTEEQSYRERLAKYGPNPKKSGDDRFAWFQIKNSEEFTKGLGGFFAEFAGDTYVLASQQADESLLHEKGSGSWQLTHARFDSDEMGRPAVGFELNEPGAIRFLALTKGNLKRPLCILLDNVAYTAPNLSSAIRNRGIITGTFSQKEVSDLVDTLNAGSLPARLGDRPISLHKVGPTIGRDNLTMGQKAGVWGLVSVLIFMFIYYTVPGLLAGMALLMNLLFILATMAFMQATFTLPGIAGIILTIGMAVDANVLIFERIREEQQKGSSLRIAIRNGYDRAFRTILDANITTFIVAAILWMVASEDVKGFTITLMIGIISSMFTALFVTRMVFDFLTSRNIIKNKLFHWQIIKTPQINWMGMRNGFWAFSAILIIGGWAIFLSRDEAKNSKYSIEFTGGTSIHVVLNEAGADMDRAGIQSAIRVIGENIGNPNIARAGVQKIGEDDKHQFEIVTTATNHAVINLQLAGGDQRGADDLRQAVIDEAEKLGDHRLTDVKVKKGDSNGAFLLETIQVNVNRLRNVLAVVAPEADVEIEIVDLVNQAVRNALDGKLDVQSDLEPTNMRTLPIDPELIRQRPYLDAYLGGLFVSCDFGNGHSESLGRMKSRFDQFRLRSEAEKYGDNDTILFGPGNLARNDQERITGLELAVLSDSVVAGQGSLDEWDVFVTNETERLSRTLEWTTSLPRVTQIDASVGQESLNKAMIAIVFSLIAIVIYIWMRFGNIRFGMSAVVALLHDVSIAMGLVAASAWLSQSAIGRALGINDFKIDLPMIAAFLTVIGYSLNDTIVLFDRIRENRGKQASLSRDTINLSINRTLARTILTSVTTMIVLVTMYVWGGPGLRGFNYVLIIGVLIGTYSSIAIATPLLLGAQNERKRSNSGAGNNKKTVVKTT
jgi:SecD/SecF fusion protein